MSVQKTEILTFCNAKLLRDDAITDIIDEIRAVIKDLSKRAKWPDLYRADETDDRVDLVSGTSSSSLPDGLRVLDFIVINDGTNDGRPLKFLPFEKWLKRREDESSSSYDEPERYARRGKKVFWDPVPDDDYTAKFWFWRHHPTVLAANTGDDEDILFGDEFDVLIKYGVCAEVAKTHKMTGYIDIWEPRYMAEKAKMVPEEDFVTTLVDYPD